MDRAICQRLTLTKGQEVLKKITIMQHSKKFLLCTLVEQTIACKVVLIFKDNHW